MIRFEKVSFEQFETDFTTIYPFASAEEVARIYDNIKLPERSTSGSAGYDFYVPYSLDHNYGVRIMTGVRAIMDPGYVLLIYIRSSLGIKKGIVLANGTGVIDSDYAHADNEGHIQIALKSMDDGRIRINEGDRVAQGVFVQYALTDDDNTVAERTGGIGSTGK